MLMHCFNHNFAYTESPEVRQYRSTENNKENISEILAPLIQIVNERDRIYQLWLIQMFGTVMNPKKAADNILGSNNIIWRPRPLPAVPPTPQASLLPHSLFSPPNPLSTLAIRPLDLTTCIPWHSCSKASPLRIKFVLLGCQGHPRSPSALTPEFPIALWSQVGLLSQLRQCRTRGGERWNWEPDGSPRSTLFPTGKMGIITISTL